MRSRQLTQLRWILKSSETVQIEYSLQRISLSFRVFFGDLMKLNLLLQFVAEYVHCLLLTQITYSITIK